MVNLSQGKRMSHNLMCIVKLEIISTDESEFENEEVLVVHSLSSLLL